ncbi:MAG TPA: hypothetical protein VKA09_07060 [Nitrososphaeraceae archaeon]|nr:hypothetical protein [Nitrososphaeraceae archaeon]
MFIEEVVGQYHRYLDLPLQTEKTKWNKSFRNALNNSDMNKHDEVLFDIHRLYISACSYSTQVARLCQVWRMSILCYTVAKRLAEYISQLTSADGYSGRVGDR